MSTQVTRIIAAVLLAASPASLSAKDVEPWKDRSLSASVRADTLVKAMTEEEKLAYIHGLFPPMAKQQSADMIPSAGYVPGVPRLGIPNLRESDASLGVANQVEQRKGDVATALPAGLATAAGFDPALAYQGGAMIGAEARAKTFNILLAGGVNLTRDAWNGRNFEYLGEDPLLAGTMAAAAINGVQSNHIISTVKHLALNAQETARILVDAHIDEKSLRESDLLAFDIAIRGGKPGSVMCGYNLVNGDWNCENKFLLTDVLRTDWHYPGWVMSDWGAVHSTQKAALAGLDQQSGQELDKAPYFGELFVKAMRAGDIPKARLDEMVHRILTSVVASGLYDNPTPATEQSIDYATNAAVAQRIAEAGIVLLKNERGVLPLAKRAKKIVLIGGHADVGVLSGGGSSQVRSVGGAPIEIPLTSGAAASFVRVTYHNSSPLKAIRALAPDADVQYIDASDPAVAAAAAKAADVAIVFGTHWQTEAQDAPSLSLPDGQDTLIEAVAGANANTIVVLESGGPVLMPWINRVPAVLEAWYPGQRGGEAIARVLFGEVDASGRLPMTFPKDPGQLPRPVPVIPASVTLTNAMSDAGATATGPMVPFKVEYAEGADVGYRWYARKQETPLFPFGFGLSYTQFSYSKTSFNSGPKPSVSVTVRNLGKRSGVTVPQIYVTPAGQSSARLAGWKRLTLDPGASKRIIIPIDTRMLASWEPSGWRIVAGQVKASLATDANRIETTGKINVPGQVLGTGSLRSPEE